jgi:hypothetical protein
MLNKPEDNRMPRTYWLIIPLTLAMLGALSSTTAAALDAGYLAGKWEINSQGNCGSKDAEHLILRGNGTFEYGRRGKAEAVGFWRIEDDVMKLEMLTSPAYFQDIHAELKPLSGYEIQSMQAMPIDMQQNQFSAVASIGDMMERFTLQRCQ